MCRFRRSSILFLLGLLPWLGMAGAAHAANQLQLRGTIDPNCYVQITPMPRILNLVEGTGNTTVASVGEMCNSGSGYTVVLASQNGGALTSARGDRIDYTVTYNGVTRRSLATPVTITRNAAVTSMQTRSFNVQFPANPRAIAGDYTDTISVTIMAR